MGTDALSILPNLGIGVVAVCALVYVTVQFINHLKQRDNEHADEIKERETAMRALEKEVRDSIMKQLAENTQVLQRVIDRMGTGRRGTDGV